MTTAPRTRIGFIIPSSNVLSEPQLNAAVADDVQLHFTRLRMTGVNHVPLPALMPRIEEASLMLADARCDVIVFHCTASSTEGGVEGDRLVIELIQRVTGRPATTTATALVTALNAVNARQLSLVTPYPQETNDHEKVYLREAGFTVLGDCALAVGSVNYPLVEPDVWLRATEEVTTPDVDTVLLSCTNVRAPEVIESLESRLGRPVIASNPATLWHALHLCGRNDRLIGLGRIMDGRIALPA